MKENQKTRKGSTGTERGTLQESVHLKRLQEPCELKEVKVQITTKGAEGFPWHSIPGKHFQKGREDEDHVVVFSGWFGRGTARSLPSSQVRRPAGRAHSCLSTCWLGLELKQESEQH